MPKVYTGQLLKKLRPDDYRAIVEFLAVPRPFMSHRKIARDLHVSKDTVKAVEEAEAETIATAKSRLLRSTLRIAQKAADRVEDTIPEAGCSQAAVVLGISTEKALLLAGEPTQHIAISLNPVDIYSELRQVQATIIEAVQAKPALTLADAEPVQP